MTWSGVAHAHSVDSREYCIYCTGQCQCSKKEDRILISKDKLFQGNKCFFFLAQTLRFFAESYVKLHYTGKISSLVTLQGSVCVCVCACVCVCVCTQVG